MRLRHRIVSSRIVATVFVAILAATLLASAAAAGQASVRQMSASTEPPPYWAYAINPPEAASAPAKPPDDTPRHVPGSDAAFTDKQIHDLFSAPDWHPADHPPMPEIVSRGRQPQVFACGFCRLPDGQGRPENASLAGLPAAYIVQQLADFKSGLRKSSDPRHVPTSAMIAYETKANDEEIQTAAVYFSALSPRPWIRVVETDTVPKTHVAGWMLVADSAMTHPDMTHPEKTGTADTEPIGERIIEIPENLERTELRDDHSGFIAYVPPGSIKKGETLVNGNSVKTLRCATCHGRDLKGLGKVPSLAGRSPSYIVRQLYDIQHGARAGAAVLPMKPAIAKLTVAEMAEIAAYLTSLRP